MQRTAENEITAPTMTTRATVTNIVALLLLLYNSVGLRCSEVSFALRIPRILAESSRHYDGHFYEVLY